MQDPKDSTTPTGHSSNEKLFELDREFADFFIQNLPGELEKLKYVCNQNDPSGIKFQAHKMVPTLSMMNNHKATELLKSLSKLDDDAADIKQIAQAAIEEVEAAIIQLQEIK